MKRALLLSLVLAFGAGTAFAQAGSIGICADQRGTVCNLSDVPGLTQYYVVHMNTQAATACQYSAPKPACFTGIYLSDTNPFPVTIGNSQIGVSIGYGVCKSSPIYVQAISYFTYGTTPPCCFYWVRPDPTASPPGIYVVDCAQPYGNLLVATGGAGLINRGPTCCCGCSPTEDSTWGQVKALYGE